MPTTSIRVATNDDIEKIAAIEAQSHYSPWSAEAIKHEMEKKFSHFWLLTDDETDSEIYSYIVFSLPDNVAFIHNIATHKNFRKQGYATQIIRAVINYALRNGGDAIFLDVRITNQAAIQLYQKLGFVITQKRNAFYSNGEDAYEMCFRLHSITESNGDDE